MTTEHKARRIAILIDAENVPASTIGRVIWEVEEKFGSPCLRRAYGDFNGPQAAVWEEVFARQAIVPHHQFAYGRGKNSADIALVIDAMDLLHSGDYDAFCIVSSDADFMRLAIRIREQNLDCYVFGSHKTPERFKRACTRFVHLENLRFDAHNAASDAKMKPLRPISDAKQIIRTSMTSLAVEPGSWVLLDHLKRELEHQRNDFDPRTYGHLRLRDLLIALGRPVIVDAPRDGEVRVRLIIKKRKAKSPVTRDRVHVLADAGRDDTHVELGIAEHGS